ncbi:hypothetical protein M1N56_01470 [Dehalococcoidia bacterium]|nr:hypothetical protein [Dehalococcoidia bacterium]
MGNISENRLGGLGLLIGPGLATVLYIVIFVILGGGGVDDPTNFTEAAAQSVTSLQQILWLFPAISLIFFFYGLTVLHNDIKESGSDAAILRLGSIGVFFGILGIFLGVASGFGSNWDATGHDPATLQAVGASINTYGGFVWSLGLILVTLAVASNREGMHKIFAYSMTIVATVNLIIAVMDLLSPANWETTLMIYPIIYLVFSIWSITLGLNLMKKA